VLGKDDLTPEERTLVECHVVHGAERVEAASGPATAALVRHHHERVDGSGYPDGLAGEQIPLGARIIAVADRFDELVSPGRRQPPSSRRGALDELSARAGSELDAAVVAAFVGYYSGARSIAGVALAATAPQRAVRWLAAAPATIGSASAPVVVQGVCAAGTAALASACLGGLPAAAPEDADRPPAQQRVDHGSAADGLRAAALSPAAADPVRAGGDGRRSPARRGGDRDGAGGPGSGAPQAPVPGDGGSGGGGGTTPTAPQGGGGEGGSGGGQPTSGGRDGGGGGASPTDPVTPTTPVQPPPQQVQAPPAPVGPASQIVDPVLDGVSDAVPQAKPITDAVKGLVGGLGGSGQ
jgi:hypothetical protein